MVPAASPLDHDQRAGAAEEIEEGAPERRFAFEGPAVHREDTVAGLKADLGGPAALLDRRDPVSAAVDRREIEPEKSLAEIGDDLGGEGLRLGRHVRLLAVPDARDAQV